MTTPSTHTHLLQVCRTCGGGAPVDVHFCPSCTKIMTLGRQGDYFSFLGLPRKLELDAAALEQRFRALSRQFHPDFYYNAAPTERRDRVLERNYINNLLATIEREATGQGGPHL